MKTLLNRLRDDVGMSFTVSVINGCVTLALIAGWLACHKAEEIILKKFHG